MNTRIKSKARHVLVGCLVCVCVVGCGLNSNKDEGFWDGYPERPSLVFPETTFFFEGHEYDELSVTIAPFQMPLFQPWSYWSFTNNEILSSMVWIDSLTSWSRLDPEWRYRACDDRGSDAPVIYTSCEVWQDSLVLNYRLVDNYDCIGSDHIESHVVKIRSDDQLKWWCGGDTLRFFDNLDSAKAMTKWGVSSSSTLPELSLSRVRDLNDPVTNTKDRVALQRLALKYHLDSCSKCMCEWSASTLLYAVPLWCNNEERQGNIMQLYREGSCGLDSLRYWDFLVDAARLDLIINPDYAIQAMRMESQ